jgi:hypothetical protein
MAGANLLCRLPGNRGLEPYACSAPRRSGSSSIAIFNRWCRARVLKKSSCTTSSVRDAVLFGGFIFRVLLTVVALCATSALAETPDTIDDTGVPKLPVFGPTMLRFKACSAGGRELDVQVKVINFSAGDVILPDGYVWATKEENAAAALEVMKSVYGRHLSYMPDANVENDGLLSEIALGRDIVRGTDDKGNPEERRVSTGLRILLETKMALMAKGKYSGMSVNFEPQNTFVKLTDKECDPLIFRE